MIIGHSESAVTGLHVHRQRPPTAGRSGGSGVEYVESSAGTIEAGADGGGGDSTYAPAGWREPDKPADRVLELGVTTQGAARVEHPSAREKVAGLRRGGRKY